MSDVKTELPIGLEFETIAVDADRGRPLDLSDVLADPICHGDFGRVTPDGAGDQIEFVTNPSCRGKDHLEDLRYLAHQAAQLNAGKVRYLFCPRRPQTLPQATFAGWKKERLKALRQALANSSEGGVYGDEVVNVGNINAYHIHFGFPDACSDEAMLACCALNAAAPTILEWMHSRFNIPAANRNVVWLRFARSSRLPGPFWHETFQAYHAWFESQPRLVRQLSLDGDKHTGKWEVDLRNPQTVGDPASEGTVWHTVRLRPSYQTVEFRPLPTIGNYRHALQVAKEIDTWIARVIERVGDRQFSSFDEAVRSGYLPNFCGMPLPANKAEWWRRWFMF